jgi:putative tricarboxylic transport membrane protein
MLEHLLVVLGGILIGTMSGVLPGIGTSISLIIATPILIHLDVTQLFLFYMAILSTAQYTGTIPSIFLQIPGESNSMPALIEGAKFRRKNLSSLAIGLCAIGSVFGSLIAVIITIFAVPYLMDFFVVFLKDDFRITLYGIVLLASLFSFNNKRYALNFVLLVVGYCLSFDIRNNGCTYPIFIYTQRYQFTVC